MENCYFFGVSVGNHIALKHVKVCSLLFQMDCMGENLFLQKLESNLYKKDI